MIRLINLPNNEYYFSIGKHSYMESEGHNISQKFISKLHKSLYDVIDNRVPYCDHNAIGVRLLKSDKSLYIRDIGDEWYVLCLTVNKRMTHQIKMHRVLVLVIILSVISLRGW